MTTHVRCCPICEQRFVVDEVHNLTCSKRCRIARQLQLSKPAPIFRAHFAVPRSPNRARAALAETRAAVASLLTEGRQARLTSEPGDPS